MTLLGRKKIALALASTQSWPLASQRIRALSDDELVKAEEFERLGKRRRNMLSMLKIERHRRQGKGEKMLRLRVEGNL